MTTKEMIEVLQAFEDGKEILGSTDSDMWYTIGDKEHLFDFKNNLYRIKPEPSRAEITKKWVEDNKIEVGSRVKVVKKVIQEDLMWPCQMDDCIGGVYTVKSIYNTSIYLSEWFFPVESLEPYKEQWVPFTFEDRDMFRDKWIRLKCLSSEKINEHRIVFIGHSGTVSCSNWIGPIYLSDLFNTFEFIDGTPFGKQL